MEEEILKFPCSYAIKVFGKNSLDFETAALNIITKYCDAIDNSQISKRESSSGKFVALTVRIIAISRTQIDAINEDLQAHPLVEYLL